MMHKGFTFTAFDVSWLQIGALLGIKADVVAAVELRVMIDLDWAPTAGWQVARRAYCV